MRRDHYTIETIRVTDGKITAIHDVLEFARSRMQRSPFSVLLGFEIERLSTGGATLVMSVKDHHRQIHNVVHGGAIAALADTAGAIAAYTTVPSGTELVTIELKINYLLPIAGGKVEAEGRVLRTGRNFVVVECDVRTERGELAAKALMTFGGAGRSADSAGSPTAKTAAYSREPGKRQTKRQKPRRS